MALNSFSERPGGRRHRARCDIALGDAPDELAVHQLADVGLGDELAGVGVAGPTRRPDELDEAVVVAGRRRGPAERPLV